MFEPEHLWSNRAHLRAVEVACRTARNDEREEMRRELEPVLAEMRDQAVCLDPPGWIHSWGERIEEVLA